MKKILLVDDEESMAGLFQTVLKQAGFEVALAEDGKTALDMVKGDKFDLILMDQMMPEMSGNDALLLLKQDEMTKNIPVAMLTNFSHDELVNQALGRGAVEYILKYQISHEDLVNKVKVILGDA